MKHFELILEIIVWSLIIGGIIGLLIGIHTLLDLMFLRFANA
jgi:hypothetical protein